MPEQKSPKVPLLFKSKEDHINDNKVDETPI